MKPENAQDEQYIFRGSTLMVLDSSYIELPQLKTARMCLEENLARDWFVEPEAGYAAIQLEDDAPTPSGHRWLNLRELFAEFDKRKQSPAPLATRALALLNWRKISRFCGKCGGPMQEDKELTARTCMLCGLTVFPRLSPAIIVLIEKEGRILLARHRQRNTNVFTCLAGFVENGETIEECVAREVREECGIEIQNICYISSQAWPYPDQLMLAFRADWKSGELVLQTDEIDEAAWFSRDKLPDIPRPGTVAHKLIFDKSGDKQ